MIIILVGVGKTLTRSIDQEILRAIISLFQFLFYIFVKGKNRNKNKKEVRDIVELYGHIVLKMLKWCGVKMWFLLLF